MHLTRSREGLPSALPRLVINDLKRQNQEIGDEIQQAIARVLERGWYGLGPEIEAFESAFAEYCGTAHAVGVGNGTDAIEIALRCAGVTAGDEVVTVANAGMYSTTAIRAIGAIPVYADVDALSMNMAPEGLEAVLSERNKAVVVTHLYGRAAAMAQLVEIARRWDVPLIEDCAQAHGAQLEGRTVGTWGLAGCFSFYPTKNLGALGDAGAIITSDPRVAEHARALRQYGWTAKYHASFAGGRNSRMDELQAAILRAKLRHLDRWNDRRRAIAKFYSEELPAYGLKLPEVTGADYVAHLYVVRSTARDVLKKRLEGLGIGTEIHYPLPDYRQLPEAERTMATVLLPETERCCREVLTLPCFPEMTDVEMKRVVAAVRE